MGVKEKLHVGVLCACVEPREAPLLVIGIGTAGGRDVCACGVGNRMPSKQLNACNRMRGGQPNAK